MTDWQPVVYGAAVVTQTVTAHLATVQVCKGNMHDAGVFIYRHWVTTCISIAEDDN